MKECKIGNPPKKDFSNSYEKEVCHNSHKAPDSSFSFDDNKKKTQTF